MKNSRLIYSIFSSGLVLFNLPSQTQAFELCGKIAQGEILTGKAEGYKSVTLNGTEHQISPTGDFIIAFGRDDRPEQKLTLTDEENNVTDIPLTVSATKWDIQNIKGIPQRKVTPSKEDEAAILHERNSVRGALTADLPLPYWLEGFIEPVKGRISGLFGGQRIMNGIKRNPHGGTDIAAPEGTPVKAAASGIVMLSAPDLFYSGNVVVIDHGHGLQTIYAHLKKYNVKKGDKVKQGDIIGLVGKTGRVTGPHLHWGASLRGTRFNPYSLLNINKSDVCLTLDDE